MITKLYDGIGIKVRQKAPSKREITPLKTQIVDTIIPAINIAEIILQSIASDALDLVKFLTKKFSIAKIDITYIYLDLEDENLPDLVEKLEEMGYIFAGIFPHYHHDNALVFQFINNLKFDYSLIQSYTPLAKELRDYICLEDPNQINE